MESHINDIKRFTCSKLYLTLLCEYFIFPTPYHPHIWCGSWSVCVCVCVCVWLFFSFCFLFSLSYWLSYFCLVTIVLSVMLAKCYPHPPCNYYDYYYFYMQRLKESCNFLDSVPGLPCAQKVEEKEGKKTRNKFFRSKYNSKLSI